jgi:hypothetical protein
MKKNEALPGGPWVTPTTKEEAHDVPISGVEVVSMGLMDAADWEATAARALAVFRFGQAEAAKRGLILVDTKYEFGRDPATGEILLIDEVHTPDSSRYWLSDSYASRLSEGKEPDNIDKEFLRLWFKANCDPYGDAALPTAPGELVAELSSRYIRLYEAITGQKYSGSSSSSSSSGSSGSRSSSSSSGAASTATADLTAAIAPVSTPAATTVIVVRTGAEESGGEAAAAAEALVNVSPDGRKTEVAVEVHLGNSLHTPGAIVELAVGLRGGGHVSAVLVLPGPAAAVTAGVLALHGRVPVVCVGGGAAAAGEVDGGGALAEAGGLGGAVVFTPTVAAGLSFLKALLKQRL